MTDENSTMLAWVLAGVATVIGTLSAAVAKLYHTQVKGYVEREVTLTTKVANLEEKISHCEAEHTAAKIELAKLETRLSLVENKVNA